MENMNIELKRTYEEASEQDGYRVLVDKLWPRGMSKPDAKVDDWLKDIAPSDELRNKFHDEEISWSEFRDRYLSELKKHREKLRPLVEKARKGRVTLLFSSKNNEHNNAVVVKQYLQMLAPDDE